MTALRFSVFFQMLAISVANLMPLFWRDLGYGDATIGMLNALGMALSLVGPLWFGSLGSRIAPQRIVFHCFFWIGITGPLALLSSAFAWQGSLFALSQFLKIGYLTLVPVGVLHLLGSKAGEQYARYRRIGSMGFLAGVVGAGYLVAWQGPDLVVWIVSIASLVASIPFFAKIQIPSPRLVGESFSTIWQIPKLRWFLVGSLFFATWSSAPFVFLPLRMQELGAGAELVGWTLSLCGLFAIFTLRWVGQLGDRISPEHLYLVAPVAGALRIALMAWPSVYPQWFLLIQLLHIPTWVLSEICQIKIVRQYSPPSLFPRVQALLQSATYAGMGLASLATGLVSERFGLSQAFVYTSWLPLVALPFLVKAMRAPSPPLATTTK